MKISQNLGNNAQSLEAGIQWQLAQRVPSLGTMTSWGQLLCLDHHTWIVTFCCSPLHVSSSRILRCENQQAQCQVISGQRLEVQVIIQLKSPQNATLWMKELRSIGFPWLHSYLSANPLLFARRDWAWGQPIRKNICQQLATNLLTGNVCPFVRHGTGGMHLVRKEYDAYFSSSVNYIPGLQCRYGRKRGDWERASEMIPCDMSHRLFQTHGLSDRM